MFYEKNVLKTDINNTTIGTQIIVVQVTDNAVTFLSIPYGTRNIFVLVIGRIEFITTTANHSFGIKSKMRSIQKIIDITIGVIIVVRKNIFLTQGQ